MQINNMEPLSRRKKIYNILLVISPILSVYSSFVPGVNLGELVILLFCIYGLLLKDRNYQNRNIHLLLFLFIVYAFLVTLVSWFFDIYKFAWFSRLIRFSFYLFAIIVSNKKYFNEQYFFNVFYYISIFISISLAFQYIVYLATGRYIRLYGNILPIESTYLYDIDYESIYNYSFFRPSSFFTEPSHIAQYIIIPFVYYLFSNKVSTNKKIVSIISAGASIILSTSLWGYLLIGIVLLIWIAFSFITNSFNYKWIIIALIIGFVAYVFIGTSLFKNTFSRINLSNLNSSNSFIGRFAGYNALQNKPILQIIFGSGFGNIFGEKYANSIVYLLCGTGIVGLGFFFLVFSKMFQKNNVEGKVLTTVLAMIFFGSGIILSMTFVVFVVSIIGVERVEEKNV